MRTEINHPQFSALTYERNTLKLLGMESELPLYAGEIQSCAITLVDNMIHIVAIRGDKVMMHWSGSEKMTMHQIDCGGQPLREVQLLTDNDGIVHLFYLEQNLKQTGYGLVHRIYENGWDEPLRVTTNIGSSQGDYQISYGYQGNLHLVYLSQTNDTVYYRAFDLNNKLWSGAIPLAKEECSNLLLHVLPNEMLILWLRCTEHGHEVKVIRQAGTWTKPTIISSLRRDIAFPAVNLNADELQVIWMQGSSLWASSYQNAWSEPVQLVETEYKIEQQLCSALQGNGYVVMSVYQDQALKQMQEKPAIKQPKITADTLEVRPIPANTDVPQDTTSAPEEDKQEKARKEIEKRFFQEAFQLHQEWQTVKEDYYQAITATAGFSHQLDKLSSDVNLAMERVNVVREDMRVLRSTKSKSQDNNVLEELKLRVDRLDAARLSRRSSETDIKQLEQRLARLETSVNLILPRLTALEPKNTTNRPKSIFSRFFFGR